MFIMLVGCLRLPGKEMRKKKKKKLFYHCIYFAMFVNLFFVRSYRLQHAFDQDARKVSSFVRNVVIRTKIIAAIEIHKRALELVYAFSLKLLTTLYTCISHNILIFVYNIVA